MSDLFGQAQPREPFRDIGNTRESSAVEKANLCAELNRLCRATPHSLAGASIQAVRSWREIHKSALKVLQSGRSSAPQLRSAIESLKNWL